ncbi:MAG: type II secretion system F family protein [Candidatus Hydrogenedentes bacterium]|nr:type II secretion system F family protein [Candidatus Hydrogenedentota bacterium]
MGLFSNQISLKKVVPLCRQLATAYDAGIPIKRGLEMVVRQEKDKHVKGIFTNMHDSIGRGSTLGEAAREQQKYFPAFFVEMLATGERGGKLDVMLRDLAQYFEDRLAMRRQIIGALTYPAIQLIAAWYLGTFALGIVSELQGMFKPDAKTFNFETYLEIYLRFQAFATIIAAGIFAGCVVLSRLGLFGHVWGLFATHIWPMSPVTRKFGLARFFRSMSLLISSGLRIDHCIENSAAVVSNPYLEKDLLKALPGVRDGQTLVEAFSESRLLTPTAREMLYVGEESGSLDQTLRKVSEYHLAEATHAVQVATKILGVLIALIVGGLVGYIIITFYSRLYGGMLDDLGV